LVRELTGKKISGTILKYDGRPFKPEDNRAANHRKRGAIMVTLKDYTGITPAWCPGCGNFGILKAVNEALVELAVDPYQVLIVSGIGQAGKLPHYTRCNTLNELHGRALPAAIGAKLANPELLVIAVGGDGDGYGEGGNHFLYSMRRNHDITYLVHNNQVYGLTKGQASPTSDAGFVTRTTPEGAGPAINPLAVAIAAGATFVARGFAGDIKHLSGLITQGINLEGFALIDILATMCLVQTIINTSHGIKNGSTISKKIPGMIPACGCCI
jgi:2-oxoglutarate ferredoxin oxidoreductase subunit beta